MRRFKAGPIERRIAVLGVMLAVLGACGGTDTANPAATTEQGGSTVTKPTGVLRAAPTTLVQTFDPAKVQNAQIYYLQPLYDTLLRLGNKNEIQAGIAEKWDYNGTVANLVLRDGVKFEDGTPITASVVKQNIERFLKANGPQAVAMSTLTAAEAVDEKNVKLTFSSPSPTLLTELAMAPGMIMNPTAFANADLNTKPGGISGPYRLDPSTSASGDRYVYTVNSTYWDPSRQKTERIEIIPIPDEAARGNALKSGQLDLALLGFSQIAEFEQAGFKRSANPSSLYYSMIFDRGGKLQPALANVKVRQAMSMAIDREAVINGIFFGYGTPTPQPYLKGELGHSAALDKAMAYNPRRARELLTEAGYPNGFEFSVPTIPSVKTFAEALAGFWKAIGITANVEQGAAGGMAEAGRSGRFPVFISPSPVGDPSTIYRSFWAADAPYNRQFGVVDPKLDDLAAKGVASVDAAARAPIYASMFELAVNDGFYIPVGRAELSAVGPAKVTNVVWHTGEFFPNPVGITVR